MSTKGYIFLVEDDHNFGSVLKAYLEMNNFSVFWTGNGNEAIKLFNQQKPDLCVLDVMLPGIDGFTIAEHIRKINADTPFIFLTAKTMKEDILKGYSKGADDYITKPFDSEVLVCKIDAILSRSKLSAKENTISHPVKIGNFIFNYNLRTLEMKGKTQKMSPKETELLKLLYQHRNDVLPREHALRVIWGEDSYFTTRSMDVFITKLRKYLKNDRSIQLINIHGNGFRLMVAE